MIKQIYNKIKEFLFPILIAIVFFVFLIFSAIAGLQPEENEITESEVKILIQEALTDFQREHNYLTRDEIVNTVMDLYHDVDTGESVKTLIMEVGERGPRGFQGEKGDRGESGIGLKGEKGDRGLQGIQGKLPEGHWEKYCISGGRFEEITANQPCYPRWTIWLWVK